MDRSELQSAAGFRPVPTACRWKVGLDIGRSSTVWRETEIRAGAPVIPTGTSIPTLMVCGGDDLPAAQGAQALEIGDAAVRSRDRLPVRSPFDAEESGSALALLDYAGALRRKIAGSRTGRPWGVIAAPGAATAGQIGELRAMAGQIFERFLVVEEPALAAMAVLHAPEGRHAIVVDLGARGVRASLVGGSSVEPGHHVVVPQGGDAVDAALRRLLLRIHPDLALTDWTLARMKEQLGFVRPAERKVRLKLALNGSLRILDITAVLQEACGILAASALKAVREAMARCPSDHIEEFISSIIIVGGGAALQGLPRMIQDGLRKDGLDGAAVHTVRDPQALFALGALKWALATPDEAWGVPLFNYRPAA